MMSVMDLVPKCELPDNIFDTSDDDSNDGMMTDDVSTRIMCLM